MHQKSWDQFDEYDSQESRWVKQKTAKIKERRSDFSSQSFSSAKSPRCKFEDRSQEETERQERCARRDAWRPSNRTWRYHGMNAHAMKRRSSVLNRFWRKHISDKNGRRGDMPPYVKRPFEAAAVPKVTFSFAVAVMDKMKG